MSYSTISSGMASMYASNGGVGWDSRSQPVPTKSTLQQVHPMKYTPFFSLSEDERKAAFQEANNRSRARESENKRRDDMTKEEIKEMWENSYTPTQDDQDEKESDDAFLDGCMERCERRCEAKARHRRDHHRRDHHRRDHQDRGDYVKMKDFLSRPTEC